MEDRKCKYCNALIPTEARKNKRYCNGNCRKKACSIRKLKGTIKIAENNSKENIKLKLPE